jgi:hypothetical protein
VALIVDRVDIDQKKGDSRGFDAEGMGGLGVFSPPGGKEEEKGAPPTVALSA